MQNGRQWLRLRYAKDEMLMYIGHRDLLRFMLRIMQKTELPVAYSQGYSPKPRISLAPPLPLGVCGQNELVDIEIEEGRQYSAPELKATLACLRRAAEPRKFAMELNLLAPGTPRVAKLVQAGRYLVTAKDPALHQHWMDYIKNGSVVAANSEKNLAVNVVDAKLTEHGLVVEGAVAGERNLRISDLGIALAKLSGTLFPRLERLALLDATGCPL